jgi:hypothetical protein
MLDVHPPHEAAHTWEDFFIHIATIVVGLIIAVGLEQTVEAIHHRHELQRAREELRHPNISSNVEPQEATLSSDRANPAPRPIAHHTPTCQDQYRD